VEDKIKNALKAMLALRSAKMDPTSMRLFTARLSRENSTDVIAALQKLGEMPRAEYETAAPDISTILAMTTAEKVARENRAKDHASQRLVRWQCPECGATKCGYPSSNDSLDRRCDKIKRDGKPTRDGWPICAARMEVILDENAQHDDEQVFYQEPSFVTKARKEVPRV